MNERPKGFLSISLLLFAAVLSVWLGVAGPPTAPRAYPSDASTFTVTLKAPAGISDVHLMSGRAVSVPPDGLVAMTVEDSKPLLAIGWTQNNLEDTNVG